MAWFEYLHEAGFLSPDDNPSPEPAEKGMYIPRWNSLAYLQKLSETFRKGENNKYIQPVLEIIDNVSRHPKDNDYTWYIFTKILVDIPAEQVPVETLNHLTVWLNSRYSTMLPSSEIIQALLPKFLMPPLAAEGRKKAEIIFHHVTELKKLVIKDRLSHPGTVYFSSVYLYYLRQVAEEDRILVENIVAAGAENFIERLMNQVNALVRDQVMSAEVTVNGLKRVIYLVPDASDLHVYLDETKGATIADYWDKSAADIMDRVAVESNTNGIPESAERQKAFDRLKYNLENDFESVMQQNSVMEMSDTNYKDEDPLYVFSFLLRELLDEVAAEKPGDANQIIDRYISDHKFNLPYFHRLILYTIGGHWSSLKSVFFSMIGANDPLRLFSNYVYEDELYYLLDKAQSSLTQDEAAVIQSILDAGPQHGGEEKYDTDLWKHRWLTALKDNVYFREAYKHLSEDEDIDATDYSRRGRPRVTFGGHSPFTADEILVMDDAEVLKQLREFKNGDRFTGPDIESFAREVMRAVEKQPDKLVPLLDQCSSLDAAFIWNILYGLTEAWKAHNNFDWEKVLQFCKTYLLQNNFAKESVISFMAGLISEGVRSDENAIPKDLLSWVKDILLLLVPYIRESEKLKTNTGRMDYVMMTLNSVSGRTLRALLDYALYNARSTFGNEPGGIKWEEEIKYVFENSFSGGITQSYVLFGMYFPQFYFLDKDWSENHLEKLKDLEDENWKGFMGGTGYGSPVWNGPVYKLFYPHYSRAIEMMLSADEQYNHGIVRHMVAYYWWNYDGEKESLLYLFVQKANVGELKKLIQFIWAQDKYLHTYKSGEADLIKSKVIWLWKNIISNLERFTDADRKDVLMHIIEWTEYMDNLTDDNKEIILVSAPHCEKYHSGQSLLEALIRFSIQALPGTAPRISEIVKVMPYPEHMHKQQQDLLEQITRYLFQHGQRETAAYVCNNISMRGYEFLKSVYYKYRDMQ